MINLIIGLVILTVGLFFLVKVLRTSPSLKKRDEYNKENPMNDAFFPPNNNNGQ